MNTYILFLIGVIILVVTFSVVIKKKEDFYNVALDLIQDSILTSLNQCQRRRLAFNDLRVNMKVPQRSSCNYNQPYSPYVNNVRCDNNDSLNSIYAKIDDNGIAYELKRITFDINYDKFQNNNNGTFTFTFNNINAKYPDPLIILLHDPLFVQFSIMSVSNSVTTSMRSISYIISPNTTNSRDLLNAKRSMKYSNIISSLKGPYDGTSTKQTSFNITFAPLNDSMINEATDKDINTFKLQTKGKITITLYYIDDDTTSALQNIGKQLYHHTNNIFDNEMLFSRTDTSRSRLLLFRKDYVTAFTELTNHKNRETYDFYNHIAIKYSNAVPLTITFAFDIQINNSNKQIGNNIISKVYMNNQYGSYNACPIEDLPSNTTKNNNIFMLISEVQPNLNAYNLVFVTGGLVDQEGDCRYNAAAGLAGNDLRITLPFLKDNNKIRVYFTISDSEKKVLAVWKEDSVGETRSVFAKEFDCLSENTFVKLFTQEASNTKQALGDIVFSINKTNIPSVPFVQLGHVNLITEYAKFT